jgi:murein L,D-transpeptidase YcbB/YkuD
MASGLLASGCVTLRSQQKDTLFDEVNQLSLKVRSLEQETMEHQQVIGRLEADVADIKSKQEAQNKRLLEQVAKTTTESQLKLTNKNIQKALQAAGYNIGNIDGKIGSKTREAIMAFQKSNGLNSDGIVGGTTWEKLKTRLAEAEK